MTDIRCPCCRATTRPNQTGWNGRCWKCLGFSSPEAMAVDQEEEIKRRAHNRREVMRPQRDGRRMSTTVRGGGARPVAGCVTCGVQVLMLDPEDPPNPTCFGTGPKTCTTRALRVIAESDEQATPATAPYTEPAGGDDRG